MVTIAEAPSIPENLDEEALAESLGEIAPVMEPSPVPLGWFDNLVPELDQEWLDKLGGDLQDAVDGDDADREEYMRQVEASLDIMGRDGGVKADNTNLNKVHHNLVPEAVMHGSARIKQEAMPAEGALKAKIIGEIDESIRQNATVVEEYCNWQLYEDIDGWSDTLDVMFHHCLLSGTAFIKMCWDPIQGKPKAEFIPVEHLIVQSGHYNTLNGASRYSHQFFLNRNEYNQLVATGYYTEVEDLGDGSDGYSPEDFVNEVQGTVVSSGSKDEDAKEDEILEFYDVYCSTSLPAEDEGEDGVDSPYIVTIDSASGKVVRICRNWDPMDDTRKRLEHIVEFKLFPGLGFYGFGFYQYIGGMDQAATSAIRLLLEAGALAVNPPAFVTGGIDGGTVKFGPGMYASIPRGAEDISKNIHHIPTAPPDTTLAGMIEMMEVNARRLVQTTDLNIGDASKGNMPVGTTMALIEEGQKTTTGIHQRMHRSLKRVYKILNRLNFWYLPDVFPFATYGMTAEISRTAFDPNTIDIIPVSDPNISSMSHRITMMQEVLGMALQRPDILNVQEVYRRMLVAMKVPNPEELIMESAPPPYRSAYMENKAAMTGNPVLAYDMQDDRAHIVTHLQFMKDPSLADNPFGEQAQMILAEHVADHIARYYWKKVSMAIGITVTDDTELDPETEAYISIETAKLAMMSPMIDEIPGLKEMGEDPAVEVAIQLAQVKLQETKAMAQLKQDAAQQKVIDDSRAKQVILQDKLSEMNSKAQLDLTKENNKLTAQMETLRITAEKDREIAIGQAQLEWQLEAQKAQMEMQLEHQKHIQEVRQEEELHRQEMAAENEKLKLEIAKLEQQVQAAKDAAAEKKKSLFSRSKSSGNDSKG